MSLFGLSEKRRIAELEKQVADQQQIIDKLINLSERSVDSYAKAHNIATEAIAIAKKVVDDPDCLKELEALEAWDTEQNLAPLKAFLMEQLLKTWAKRITKLENL